MIGERKRNFLGKGVSRRGDFMQLKGIGIMKGSSGKVENDARGPFKRQKKES